jgi:hypothetical protein
MAYNYLHNQAKKWLLTFTFVISFFAVSGYVNNGPSSGHITPTGWYSIKSFTLKGGISYKRAATLFYERNLPCYKTGNDFNLKVLLDNRLAINRYHHLKQLFLFTKHSVNYPISHLYYTADQNGDATSFQIG